MRDRPDPRRGGRSDRALPGRWRRGRARKDGRRRAGPGGYLVDFDLVARRGRHSHTHVRDRRRVRRLGRRSDRVGDRDSACARPFPARTPFRLRRTRRDRPPALGMGADSGHSQGPPRAPLGGPARARCPRASSPDRPRVPPREPRCRASQPAHAAGGDALGRAPPGSDQWARSTLRARAPRRATRQRRPRRRRVQGSEGARSPVTTPIAMSTAVLVFIAIPIAIAWVAGLIDILRHPMPAGQTILWIAIVIVLPIVGTVAYFTLRKPTEREIRASQAAAADRRR